MDANTMSPDQTAPKEMRQPGQGSYCLQYRLPKCKRRLEQTTIVMKGRKRILLMIVHHRCKQEEL